MNFLKIIAIFLFSTTNAQYSDTSYLRVLGGYEKNGLLAHVSYDKHVSFDAFIRFSLEGQFEKYNFQNQTIPVQLGIFNIGYFQRLLSFDVEETTNIYIGGGLLGGYENINNGKKELSNNSEVLFKSKFIYGLSGSIQLDVYLFEAGKHADGGFFLIIDGGYNYFMNSDVGTIQPVLRMGFKITI